MKNLGKSIGNILAKFHLIGIFILAGLAVYFCLRFQVFKASDQLDGMQKIAFIMAGFVVAAFNLRFKLVDALLSDILTSTALEKSSPIFERCRTRIENYIYLFVATAGLGGIAPLLKDVKIWEDVWSIGVWSLFITSCCGYRNILNSFKELENSLVERTISKKKAEEFKKMQKRAKKREAIE